MVAKRLVLQLAEKGLVRPDPNVQLCLAAGHVRNGSERVLLAELFADRGWQLWEEHWLQARLAELGGSGYENEVAAVVAKLLLRPTPDPT